MELKSQVTREEHQYSWLCEHFRGLTGLGRRGNCVHLRTVLFDGDLASLLTFDSSACLC